MKLNPYLKDFWQQKARIKILYGGRSSSKTEDTAGFLIYLSSKYKVKIACIRKFQANIRDSVYSVIKRKIENDNYYKSQYIITNTNIISKIGSKFIFKGWERNTTEIKGLDDIDIVWIEEGETLNKKQWDIIEKTVMLRKENALIIIVFNPDLETDFVYKNFIKNTYINTITKKINYNNNPFLPESVLDYIENSKTILDEEDFNHQYLGYPKCEDESAYIKRSWLHAVIDSHIKLDIEIKGGTSIGYDIADDGEDKCAIVKRKGILIYYISEWQGVTDELEKSHEITYRKAQETNARIVYDSIGVGAGAGSAFKRMNRDNKNKNYKNIRYQAFNAGAAVDNPKKQFMPGKLNKDHFENLKAQRWEDFRNRCLETYNAVVKGLPYNEDNIVSIFSGCDLTEKLIEELSSPRREFSKRDLIKVESKDDMKKRNIESPNLADACIMCYYDNKNYSLKDYVR